MMKTTPMILFLCCTVMLTSCESFRGEDGKVSLVEYTPELAGPNCSAGGYRIQTGTDLNGNGSLEANEVLQTEYLCHGNDAIPSLLRVTPLEPGSSCPSGGYEIHIGKDNNGNHQLDTEEIESTELICHGTGSLLSVVPEPSGENCPSGGYRVLTGMDVNLNAELDSIEVQQVSFICNGGNSLLQTLPVEPGEHCLNGGLTIISGWDRDFNQLLDSTEIHYTAYLCNGADGGHSLISSKALAPGEACPNGGYEIATGVDLNQNDTLDLSEIIQTELICHPAPAQLDKEIRFDFMASTASFYYDQTTWHLQNKITLPLFNIANYPGIDSVAFVAKMSTSNPSVGCYVQLYNLTDDEPIDNGLLVSYHSSGTWVSTPVNLLGSFPDKQIELGVRGRSGQSGTKTYMSNPKLILYRTD